MPTFGNPCPCSAIRSVAILATPLKLDLEASSWCQMINAPIIIKSVRIMSWNLDGDQRSVKVIVIKMLKITYPWGWWVESGSPGSARKFSPKIVLHWDRERSPKNQVKHKTYENVWWRQKRIERMCNNSRWLWHQIVLQINWNYI